MAQQRSMNLDFGLEKGMGLGDSKTKSQICKRKNRWLFKIPGVCSDNSKSDIYNNAIDALPPKTSARPDVKWKEISIQHLSEQVYFPGKPEWSLLTISLYDLKKGKHPVFEWLRTMYQPDNESTMFTANAGFIKNDKNGANGCSLELYDGCGYLIEKWIFEDAWPQSMNFQNLDMGSNEILVCDIVLRYARAYIQYGD
jgi:hypothetical protein